MRLRHLFPLLFVLNVLHGQDLEKQEIIIGQPITDSVFFENIINYKTTKASLTNFRGTHVLLDFWGPYCIPCVQEMPKMEALQKKFKDHLQILMIGMGDPRQIQDFYQRRKERGIPFILPGAIDSVLYKRFGVYSIPHFIWIDDEGVVRAVTDDDPVNDSNLTRFIHRLPLNLLTKADFNNTEEYDGKTPLLINGYGGSVSNLLYHSFISGYMDIKPGKSYYSTGNSRVVNITALNTNLLALYQIAYGDTTYYPFGFPYIRIKFMFKDSSRYTFLPTDNPEERKSKTFCYQIIVPKDTTGEIYSVMRADLHAAFKFNVSLEKYKTKCLILVRSKTARLLTDGQTPKEEKSASRIVLINKPMATLAEMLQYYHQDRVLMNETAYQRNLDISLNCNMLKLEEVQKALEKYGLQIIEGDRDIDTLILRD